MEVIRNKLAQLAYIKLATDIPDCIPKF